MECDASPIGFPILMGRFFRQWTLQVGRRVVKSNVRRRETKSPDEGEIFRAWKLIAANLLLLRRNCLLYRGKRGHRIMRICIKNGEFPYVFLRVDRRQSS